MKEIGGYFSLELPFYNNMPQVNGILLNSCRNSLEYVLRSLGEIKCLYIPYFTCDTVMEPLDKLKIPYIFYNINECLELSESITLSKGDYLLYTNYFGVKDDYIKSLQKQYRSQLIIDNAQALFTPSTELSVYSPRKFVGVADGGIAVIKDMDVVMHLDQDYSFDRCSHLLKRIDCSAGEGYADFRANSAKLKNQSIRSMSNLTRAMLAGVDFEDVRHKRITNYSYLEDRLSSTNKLELSSLETMACPMVYPYLPDNAVNLRKLLIANKIFVATYWPNVLSWCDESMLEYKLAQNIIPLPIDQRYSCQDMQFICNVILSKNE